MDPSVRVLILMCTRNGARWLPGQLESFCDQTFVRWDLWVSDDGSTDGTWPLLEAFAARVACGHAVTLVRGPLEGAAQNYLALLTHPDLPCTDTTYLAISDQDDIWLPDKIMAALTRLQGDDLDRALPTVYGAQSVHIDAQGRRIGTSRRPVHPVRFENALVQNMVSGHSMMLNPAAAALLRRAGRHPGIAFHDWWIALVVLAAGGRVVIEDRVVLQYRQHAANVIGAPGGISAHLRRLRDIRAGAYRRWIAAQLAALDASPVGLTVQARRVIAAFKNGPSSGIGRLRLFRRLGIHRHGWPGTLVLWAAAWFGRA